MTSTKVLVLLLAVVSQVCKADLVEDAETALNVLRQSTSDNLNAGFLEHIKMSMEVDSVALDTKEAGLKSLDRKTEELIVTLKKAKGMGNGKVANCHKTIQKLYKTTADDLETCVNDQAGTAVDLIYTKSSGLTDSVLKTIYELEKQIIICGRSGEDCLNGVIAEINATNEGVAGVVNDEIEVDRQAVDEQIELIKACATAVDKRAAGFGKRCVN